jgi:Fungal protein kinase
VIKWLKSSITTFKKLARETQAIPNPKRVPMSQPGLPVYGFTAKRKLDVGFADGSSDCEDGRYSWCQILVAGELKSSPKENTHTDTYLDLARAVKEIFIAQPTRRFIHGFTICGSLMRLCEFDRLGGIASTSFDIHDNGLQFVTAMLGYLWMNYEQLGFDPTFTKEDGKEYVTITQNNEPKRLVIVGNLKRDRSMSGRATTCWRAYMEGDKLKTPLVVKDSWQHFERQEEGLLLQEATEAGVVNVAKYYHHETVCIDGKEDDIYGQVRKGLDVTQGINKFRASPTNQTPEGGLSSNAPSLVARWKGIFSIRRKKPSSAHDASKGVTEASVQDASEGVAGASLQNRIHRRVIVSDCGKKSQGKLLSGDAGCTGG